MIHHGDCIEVMAGMEPESVDAIVTDPPYGLEFMGKEWDRLWATRDRIQPRNDRGGKVESSPFLAASVNKYVGGIRAQEWHQRWAEAALRVAKPSAYLLAFGGTRTVHRMTVALEDAGWIIRDMLVWGYASGFPKSKASLKPAWEPIVMARKPGPLRMLAIDECRIPTDPGDTAARAQWAERYGDKFGTASIGMGAGGMRRPPDALGRWPANIVLTDPIFDGGVEGVVGGGMAPGGISVERNRDGEVHNAIYGARRAPSREDQGYGDSGTYSRFFLIPKADRSDREPVLGGLPYQTAHMTQNGQPTGAGPVTRQNVHPTVKPTDLMRHLVRLVTPATVTVLECANGHEHLPAVRPDVPAETDATVLLDGLSGGVAEGLGDVPTVPAGVPLDGKLAREASEVLLEGVRGSGEGATAEAMRGVRDAVSSETYGSEGVPVLFEEVRLGQLWPDETASDAEPGGLHPRVDPVASERGEVGLRDAAPSGDGRRDGPAADQGRGRRPHQRDQGRQPAREPAGTDGSSAQQSSEAAPQADRVSALSRDSAGLGTCPTCGSPLTTRTRKGHVLVPFGGSGSTALACELEGFDWTLIEREAEYVAIAEARLNGTQRGLGLDVGAPTPRSTTPGTYTGERHGGGRSWYEYAAEKEADDVGA